jgi:hypothetical protein
VGEEAPQLRTIPNSCKMVGRVEVRPPRAPSATLAVRLPLKTSSCSGGKNTKKFTRPASRGRTPPQVEVGPSHVLSVVLLLCSNDKTLTTYLRKSHKLPRVDAEPASSTSGSTEPAPLASLGDQSYSPCGSLQADAKQWQPLADEVGTTDEPTKNK